MRIGIDTRYLSHGLLGGVHSYIANFVPELIALATEHQIVLYADTKRPFELHNLPSHVTVRYLPWKNPLSSITNDLFMKRQIEQDKLDVMHFPANYGFGPQRTQTIITLHDQLTIMPLTETLAGRGTARTPRVIAMTIYLYALSRLALRGARFLLTVSEYSRREIAHYGGFDPERILIAPLAPVAGTSRVTDAGVLADARQRYGLNKPFVLADGLKNPGVIVRAWRLLPPELRDSHTLVFFSRRPEVLPIVHEGVAEGFARLIVRPPREDLTAFYSMSDAFIFPSWFEGFGLPLIEAMQCGAPVIASDRCSIPEVTRDAALLCDAEDEQTLARHIITVLTDQESAQRMRQRGYARAADFSWKGTAQRILACYERAASEQRMRSKQYL